jgi:hypothetical protein
MTAFTPEQEKVYAETRAMLIRLGFTPEAADIGDRSKAEGFEIPSPKRIASGIPAPDVVSIVHGDMITPEPIRWLWPGWLARGKLHVVAGAAGTGKTTLAAAMGDGHDRRTLARWAPRRPGRCTHLVRRR